MASWILTKYSACIGSLGVAYVADKVGRKWAYAIGLAFSYVGITLEFIATTNAMFFAGKFVKYVLASFNSGVNM